MRRKGSRQLRGTINASEVKLLKMALKSALLEDCACSETSKQELSLYLDSWVAHPIQQVLKCA